MISFRYLFILIIMQLPVAFVLCQGVALNEKGALADPSAILDISTHQKGLLIPRLTTTERNNISLPAKALLIFNLSNSQFEVNTGSPMQPSWEAIVTFESLSSQNVTWKQGGNHIAGDSGILGSTNAKSISFITNNIIRLYIDSTNGNVGINTKTPKSGLHIATTDALLLPAGTSAQRPAVPVPGMIRFNVETGKLEGYTTEGWKSLQ